MTTDTPKKPIGEDMANGYATKTGESIDEMAGKDALLKELAWKMVKYDQIELKTGKQKYTAYVTNTVDFDPDTDPKSYIVRGLVRYQDFSCDPHRTVIKQLDFKITMMD
jgi:hypothetical protein